MNRDIFLQKAKQAAKSARVIFDIGDYDGACNRSYYSMFNSARLMLDLFGHSPRSHKGVMHQFREVLVLGGYVDPALAKQFSVSEGARKLADYEGALTSRATAELTLSVAEAMCSEAERLWRSLDVTHAAENEIDTPLEPPSP